ncbi:MAG: hypothetical protein ACXWDM_15685 [Nocardioides sp.]
MSERPAYVDEHATTLAVPPGAAYAAVRAEVDHLLGRWGRSPVTRVLGTTPRAGFEIAEDDPPRLVSLAGRHRFSRYVLDFRVEPDASGSVVTALTYADFPGPRGRVYRTLVIGSRGHVLAVRRMLAGIRRRAETD